VPIISGSHYAPFLSLIDLRRFLLLFMALSALFLAGCSKPDLYSKLSEEHANEMIAVLSEAGISAEKKAAAENEWAVSVSQSDFANAVDVLRARGLPREKYESVGTLFKGEGLTTSALESRARFLFGKQEELRETISKFDGVVEARVQLAVPEGNDLAGTAPPPSASVLVKHRTGFDLRSKKAEIQTLVANGVDGLSFDRVSVVIVPAQSLPVTKAPSSGISFDGIGRILLVLFALGILGIAIRAILKQRRAAANADTAAIEDIGPKA
jgi:type III secretion protein J